MKYQVNINVEKCIAWELSLQEAVLVDLFVNLPSWADNKIIDGDTWYFFAKPKILEELPILSEKGSIDTVYRQTRKLIDKGLLFHKKEGRQDYWKLTPKIKEWVFNKELTSFEKKKTFGKKSETFGKKSDNSRKNFRKLSEKNPTYNDTNYHDTNIINIEEFFKKLPEEYKKIIEKLET